MIPHICVRWLISNLKEFGWSLVLGQAVQGSALKQSNMTRLFHAMYCLYMIMGSRKLINQSILHSNRLSFRAGVAAG